MTKSVGSEFPKEVERVEKLLQVYKDLGFVGVFGANVLQGVLERAKEAQESGDIVAIVRSYEELRGCE